MSIKTKKKRLPKFNTWTQAHEWFSRLDKPTPRKEIRREMKWQKEDLRKMGFAAGYEVVGFQTNIRRTVKTVASTTAIFRRIDKPKA